MFMHNFKYTLKTLFKDKALIFWTFAFPIILGTLFNMAFSNIENNEKLNIIDIAIIENSAYQENVIFKQTLNELSKEENEDRLFNIKYVNEEEAKKLLDDKEISGYLIFNENEISPKIVIASNGINETILKYVVEEIIQTREMSNNLMKFEIKKANIENISNSNLSYTMIEFYTLIAMVCLYGGILGMCAINKTLANMSNNGKRVSVSPTSKFKMVLSSALAAYIAQLIGLALLFVYTIFVLKVDYGSNFMQIVLLSLVGCLAGLSMGIAIATVIKANERVKTGISISVAMFGCFLSGMMGVTMKYIVDTNLPIINKINPANMITDGFYSLYYYDTFDRFYFNIISLLIFSAIMLGISIISLRRQKYDSI